jgi:hypothetical protein
LDSLAGVALPTFKLRDCVAVNAGVSESVAFTVKYADPVAGGIPLIVPVEEFRKAQGGSDPLAILQV